MAARRGRFRGKFIAITFPLSFEREYEEDITLCRRDGGVPLKWYERLLIRASFSFTGLDEEEELTPDLVMGQLANTVAGSIDRGQTDGFDQAYGELVRYHHFLLAAQNGIGGDGEPRNYAEFGYFASWEAPYSTWIRHYRRLFERAAMKLDVEQEFIRRLAYAPRTLLPKNALERSQLSVVSILDLGIHFALMLGVWFSRRTTAETTKGRTARKRLTLTGSDERAYRIVIYEFVSAWESLISWTPSIYQWKPEGRIGVSQSWKAMTRSWPFFQRHVRNTAYIAASAVWNQDQLGADRYRDMLVRWIDSARPDIHDDYVVPDKWLLLPSDFLVDWDDLKGRISVIRNNHPIVQGVSPEALFSDFLRHLYDDVLTIATAALLQWRFVAPHLGEMAEKTAAAIFRREVIQDGSARRPQLAAEIMTPFRMTMACVVRGVAGPGASYGAFLDDVVRVLSGIVEELKVPNRMYSGFGWDGRQSLDLQMLAVMIASLPAQGDNDFCKDLDEACGRPGVLGRGDDAMRSIIQEFNRLLGFLRDKKLHGAIGNSVAVLSPEASLEDGVPRLIAIMTEAIDRIEKQRTGWLRNTPIDEAKRMELRQAMARTITLLPTLPWSRGARFQEGGATTQPEETTFYWLDKGHLTDPPMIQPSLNGFESWSVSFTISLVTRSTNELLARPREKVSVASEEAFWETVRQRRKEIGPHPVLFVPVSIANRVAGWAMELEEKPDFIGNVSRDPNQAGVNTLNYMGVVDGITVFNFTLFPEGETLLFSAEALKTVAANPLDVLGHIVDVNFKDDGDPHQGRLVATMALELQWDDSPMIEIHIEE